MVFVCQRQCDVIDSEHLAGDAENEGGANPKKRIVVAQAEKAAVICYGA